MTAPTKDERCQRCGYTKSAHELPTLSCCSQFVSPVNQTQSLEVVALTREQRLRAVALEDLVAGDPALAAHELIYLRDALATVADMLSPMTHPETKAPIGFHMCFVRDVDVPSLQRVAKNGVVSRDR